MSDLNGAYYGPAVPPAKSSHSHGRKAGRGCGCGCGCCLLTLIIKIVVSFLVLLGLALLILWLIFRPVNSVRFHVTDARLTSFNLTTANSTLQYDLAVNITVRNPNTKIGVFYDRIEARLFYEDQRLESKTLAAFYQGHKNTTVISAAFSGEKLVMLGDDVAEFNEEKVSGFYSIDVKLYMTVRFRLGKVRVGKFKPRVGCDLKVPVQGSAVAGGGFQATKCDFDL